jgi:DNA-binding NarL/FixJ family response regulator
MRKLAILLIDDDQIERLKFKRVCQKNNFNHVILEAKNGEEAIDLLSNEDHSPDLILLDLNMPKMNGIEFLTKLKSMDRVAFIPIVIISSSNNFNDVKECYKIGIAGYIIKPLHYEDYSNRIVSLLSYWKMNELPTSLI